MTVAELITELQKMPQDADVAMWVKPGESGGSVYWVENRGFGLVNICDKYWTPYAEEDEE